MFSLLDIIYPKFCVGCGRWGSYICKKCGRNIHTLSLEETICPVCERPSMCGLTHRNCKTRYSIDGLISAFSYSGVMRKAIKTLKYQKVSDIAQYIVKNVAISFLESKIKMICPNNFSLILSPIPIHKQRLQERGFNQSLYIAKCLAQRLHLPIVDNLLIRAVYTEPQVTMTTRGDRLKNMKGVFSYNADVSNIPLSKENTAVLLIDDVFTTGATLREAAGELKKAGFRTVWGFTLAR